MRHALWLPVPFFLATSALVFDANGLTLTTLASLLLPALCVTLALRRRHAALSLTAAGVLFVLARLALPASTRVEQCDDGVCVTGRLRWQRVIDEREATRAGLYLSSHLGAMRRGGEEFTTFDALLDSQWKALPEAWRGGPNALLLTSSLAHVQALRVRARGEGKRPAIVFLHGFGGLLTLYVHALAEGTGGRFDVIAPALDPGGGWWLDRGLGVIERTLAQLPDDVDREQVFLVGLSNGGVGASEVLHHPDLARRFAGVVLLSGVGDLSRLRATPPTRVLLVSGTRDPRFQDAWVEAQVEQLRAQDTRLSWKSYDADHFLMLTHAREWTRDFVRWSGAGARPVN